MNSLGQEIFPGIVCNAEPEQSSTVKNSQPHRLVPRKPVKTPA